MFHSNYHLILLFILIFFLMCAWLSFVAFDSLDRNLHVVTELNKSAHLTKLSDWTDVWLERTKRKWWCVLRSLTCTRARLGGGFIHVAAEVNTSDTQPAERTHLELIVPSRKPEQSVLCSWPLCDTATPIHLLLPLFSLCQRNGLDSTRAEQKTRLIILSGYLYET